MHVHGAGELRAARDSRPLAQRVSTEQRLRGQLIIRVEFEHLQLVLPLDGDIDPAFVGVKIHMPWAKTIAAAGRDRRAQRKTPVVEVEQLERTRILGLVLACAARRIVAAGDQNSAAPARCGQDLMGEDANIEPLGLRNQFANRAVVVERMHADAARLVVCAQQVAPGGVQRAVNGSARQRTRG